LIESEVKVEAPTAPALPEAQSEQTETPQETSTPLTKEDLAAFRQEIEAREVEIRKELESAYKTLRRGEAKSDTAHKEIASLKQELFEISLRGLEPQQQEIERLKRSSQDAQSRSAIDPNAEQAAFANYATSVLAEEGIDGKDSVLTEWFGKYGEGWQNQADLKVALTRAIAKVHSERAKQARAESVEKEKKAREEERAKLRNENRQQEGKVDKGTPASTNTPKNFLQMSDQEFEAFRKARR